MWQTLLDLLQNDRCNDGIFQQIKVGILVETQSAGGFSRFDILGNIGWLCIEPLRENSMLVRCEEIDCTAC